MWTIRCADRLRFPRVPCLARRSAGERGEMLASPTYPPPPPPPRSSTRRNKTMRLGDHKVSRPRASGAASALDHSTITMANDDCQRAFATPADIERNRRPASIGIRWPTSVGIPGRIHRNPQAHRVAARRGARRQRRHRFDGKPYCRRRSSICNARRHIDCRCGRTGRRRHVDGRRRIRFRQFASGHGTGRSFT